MHSCDWIYAVELPRLFFVEHPLGSVLGKAKYGDFFFFYQGTTVGGQRNSGGKLYYPNIGNNVIMYANSSILGNSIVGNNVVVSADTTIRNESVPDNCIVFGQSPKLVIKQKTFKEIMNMQCHIWEGL